MKDVNVNLLVLRYLDGDLSPEEEVQFVELLRDDPAAQTFLRDVAEQAVTVADLERATQSRNEEGQRQQVWPDTRVASRMGIPLRGWRSARRWLQAIAVVAAAVALIVWLGRSGTEPSIAHIKELRGSVRWTGNGGQVVHDLEVGRAVRGGTLESMSAESWSTLEFLDGSTVTISGQSMLTISHFGQREVHLRRGSLSASVKRQPAGKPMLIHTPTAEMEVVGTQFNVESEGALTMLSVNEGSVRLTRLADGKSANVPAEHQVVAAVDHNSDLVVTRRLGPETAWRSELPAGKLYGTWVPSSQGEGGRVRADLMFVKSDKKNQLLKFYVSSLAVSRGRANPVELTPDATFRIHGHIDSSQTVIFGLTMKHMKGGFAGKYLVRRKFEATDGSPVIDIELKAEEFRPLCDGLSDSPIGLEVFEWWCCTYGVDAGLSVEHVELLPALTNVD